MGESNDKLDKRNRFRAIPPSDRGRIPSDGELKMLLRDMEERQKRMTDANDTLTPTDAA